MEIISWTKIETKSGIIWGLKMGKGDKKLDKMVTKVGKMGTKSWIKCGLKVGKKGLKVG